MARKKSQNKTGPTDASVPAFIAAVPNATRRADAAELVGLMGGIAGEPPVMWGPTMVGFGHLRYVYGSGRSGEMFRMGFAPRTSSLVIYSWSEFDGAAALIDRLGKLKRTAGCLYVNKLDDIDRGVLRELLTRGYAWTLERFAPGESGITQSGQAKRAKARGAASKVGRKAKGRISRVGPKVGSKAKSKAKAKRMTRKRGAGATPRVRVAKQAARAGGRR